MEQPMTVWQSTLRLRSNLHHYESTSFQSEENPIYNSCNNVSNSPVTITGIYYLLWHVISEAKFEDFFRLLGHRLIAEGDNDAKHPNWDSWLVNMKGCTLQ